MFSLVSFWALIKSTKLVLTFTTESCILIVLKDF